MKKPFSIVDAALNVIRVCLAAGILITLFDFFTRIDQTPAIVIRFPKSAETEETSGYEPEYTAGTQIIQKSRGYKKPELLTEEPEPEISAIAENETEPILNKYGARNRVRSLRELRGGKFRGANSANLVVKGGGNR